MDRRRRRRKVTPEVERIVEEYYMRGYNAKDICKLLEYRGVNVSHSHMRNVVIRRLGLLRRRNNRPDAQTVMNAVRDATRDGSNADASSATLTQVLRVQHNVNTVRSDVLAAQRQLHPERVQERRRGQLRRRVYASEGSNFQWHIDGYDKLAPFGLPIHGGIDGFSRHVLWLELSPSNRRPEQTCQFFLDAVEHYGLPHSIRVDAGSENKNIKWAQRFLTSELPRLTPLPPVLIGSSNHNERIERFWGCLRVHSMNWWINHFKVLVAQGLSVPWDDVDRKVGYFVYQHLVREDLNESRRWHNDHLIRRQNNPEIVTGKPLLLYRFPEEYGHRECRLQPSQRDLAMARDQLAENVEFDEDFRQALTELVRHADMVYPPRNIQEADDMYVELRTEMRAIIE